MKRSNRSLCAQILCVSLLFGNTACITRVPDSLATIDDVFAYDQRSVPPADAPNDAKKGSIYSAAFEDVFRAAEVSASQVQFNVEHINRDKGLILATRTIRSRNPNGGEERVTQQYTYAIWVQEVGPESTRVDVVTKFQSECSYMSGLTWTLMSILTFGIVLPAALIGYPMERRTCTKASTVQWASAQYDSLHEMSQLLTFIRNNLIAAGAI